MIRFGWLLAVGLLCVVVAASSAPAVTLGQTDDFQAGTTLGWSEGGLSPNPPTVILGGGPAGVGDNYLQNISAGGAGPGSKLVMDNTSQWTGDYLSSGIGAIGIDLNNQGATTLHVRVAILGGGGAFVTTNPITLGPSSGWVQSVVTLGATDFTPVSGNGAPLGTNLPLTASTVSRVRLLSSASPSWNGDAIAGTLGVDNIVALVPEPSSLLLALLGLAGFALYGRRRVPQKGLGR